MAEGKKHKSEPKEYMEHKTHKKHKTTQTLVWVFGAVALAAIILLIISIFTHGFSGASGKVISEEEAKAKTLTYINTLLQGQAEATVDSITDRGDLYAIKLNVGGREYDSYITKDGSLLFPSAIDMTATPETPAEPEPQEMPKTDKPTVQLFVMSECPYGVQAEEAFFPVIKALAGQINFELHFIANDNGDGTFQSLHGQKEVDENIRQVCAMKYYPNAYIDYISCQNQNFNSGKDISTTWEECIATAKLDLTTIKTCAEGTEGKELFIENIKLAEEKGVGGSPTMYINDVSYNSARTAAAFQQTVCGAFNTAPTSCDTVIDTTTTAPSGSC